MPSLLVRTPLREPVSPLRLRLVRFHVSGG
jgi:hypothetical protein